MDQGVHQIIERTCEDRVVDKQKLRHSQEKRCLPNDRFKAIQE
jgi:hypothetical protein